MRFRGARFLSVVALSALLLPVVTAQPAPPSIPIVLTEEYEETWDGPPVNAILMFRVSGQKNELLERLLTDLRKDKADMPAADGWAMGVMFPAQPDQRIAAWRVDPATRRFAFRYDANNDGDLTDENELHLRANRPLTVALRRVRSLEGRDLVRSMPYALELAADKDRAPVISFRRAWVRRGRFSLGGKEYMVQLDDMDNDGFYSADDEDGTTLGIDLNQDGKIQGTEEYFFLQDLIPIGELVYELPQGGLAWDGSLVQLNRVDRKVPNVAAGQPAPDFEVPCLDGKTIRLRENLGSRATVVYTWSTGNATTALFLAELDALRKDYAEKGVKMVSICIDEAARKPSVERVLGQIKTELPVGFPGQGRRNDVSRNYRQRTPGMIVLIDKDGNLVTEPGKITNRAGLAEALDKLVQ